MSKVIPSKPKYKLVNVSRGVKYNYLEHELKDLLKAIDEKLDKFLLSAEQTDFISYEQAMGLFDCSRQTLDRMRSDKLFQVYKLRGKGRLFVSRKELMSLFVTDSSSKIIDNEQLSL